MCVWLVVRLPQRIKPTFFDFFSSLQAPFGNPPLEKISKNVDFNLRKTVHCPDRMDFFSIFKLIFHFRKPKCGY